MAQNHTNGPYSQGNNNTTNQPTQNYNYYGNYNNAYYPNTANGDHYGYDPTYYTNTYNNSYNNSYTNAGNAGYEYTGNYDSTNTNTNYNTSTPSTYSTNATYDTPYNSYNNPNNNANNQSGNGVTNTANTTDSSLPPHFWEDCEYINYVRGADSCSMCEEEVEDDQELQNHLIAHHHVVFFACTKCMTVYSTHEQFISHTCNPPPPPPPSPPPTSAPTQDNTYKKRKRFNRHHHPPPPPKKSPKPVVIPEKVRLNDYGAVYVPPQKRLQRQKPTRGTTQIQDMLQWQQSYTTNTNTNSANAHAQQEWNGEGGELVVREENEGEAEGIIPLTRELLSEAKQSTDGISVDIERMPTSAILCRTCSLLFASSYQLNRHAGFSKFHKKNVDKQRRQEQKALRFDVTGDTSQTPVPVTDPDTYRDRSAERRAENPGGCVLDYQPVDVVTEYISPDAPIEASNVGRKLLESMGWKEGKGLGKNEVGIVNPIVLQKMQKGAGLGAEINHHEVAAAESSTYSDYLKNKKMARYAQLSKTIRDPVLEPPLHSPTPTPATPTSTPTK